MLEWKGLLPKCCSCGMKLGLRPNPRGWKTCGDPRRKVVLGWGYCERISVGDGQWLGWGYWETWLGRSRGGVWLGCCVARDRCLDTIYCGGGWPNPHSQLRAQKLGGWSRGQTCNWGVWPYPPIGAAHHAVLRGRSGHKAQLWCVDRGWVDSRSRCHGHCRGPWGLGDPGL